MHAKEMATARAPLRVTPEAGRADRAAFLDLPYRLYRGHPTWVAPLRSEDAKLMNPAKNPFFAHATTQHFLARRGARVVGRIAACENRLHNEVHADRIGFFGFFEVEAGDQDAASALIEAAAAWCRARGLAPMRGPTNYSTNDSCGTLVDGFDEAPFLLMPYNRPDHDALLRSAGLVAVKDLLAFWIPSDSKVPDRFRRVVDRKLARSDITIRDIDLAHFDREVQILKDLYNRSWEKNWGFVPATDAEFEHAAADLKRIVEPQVSGVAMRGGVPVGFSTFIRDVNQILRKGCGDGRLWPPLILRLLFGLPRVGHLRCVLLGIVPEARGHAINEALFIRAIETAGAKNYPGAEAGWVLEDNAPMRRPIEAAGGRVTKRYRMYETASS